MDFEEEFLVDEEEFVFDNLAYKIVRIINEDLELSFSISNYSRNFTSTMINVP